MIPPKRVHPRSSTALRVDGEAVVSAELWAKFKNHAAYAQYSPFVVALAAGTLKMESLLNYLGQDLYYLEKYVEACAMAQDYVINTEDKQAYKKKIEHTRDYAKEMQKFISAKERCPNMASVDYTSFLLATAAGKLEGGGKGPSEIWKPIETTKIPAYSICSMTTCSRLYRFLGQEFANALGSALSDHPYRDWIKMIFPNETTPLLSEQMLDRLVKSLTVQERESVLRRVYYHAFNNEIEFFLAVPLYQRTSVPLLKQCITSNCRYTIIVSWTVWDPSTALEKNPKLNVPPSRKANTFDDVNLNNFLEQLNKLEIKSNSNSKVAKLDGLQSLNIDIKKPRELKQILRMASSKVDVHIVSVRGSGDIINSAFLSSGLDRLYVHSNKPTSVRCFLDNDFGGNDKGKIDKLTIFNNIESLTEEDGMQQISIFIGASVFDFLCLLYADIGIVIGKSPALEYVGKLFGVTFVSLFSGLLKQEKAYAEGYTSWRKQSGTLYTVSSWSEIYAFLVGFSN